MEAKNLLITFVLVSMAILGISIWMVGHNEYSNIYGQNFTNYSYLSKAQEIQEISDEMSRDIKSSRANVVDFFTILVKGGWVALQSLFQLPTLTVEMYNEINKELPWKIPSWAFYGVLTILTIVIIFIILRAIFKTQI